MRLRAGVGMLLLAAGACAHVPDHLKVEVDGRSIEVKKKGADPEAAAAEEAPEEPEDDERR